MPRARRLGTGFSDQASSIFVFQPCRLSICLLLCFILFCVFFKKGIVDAVHKCSPNSFTRCAGVMGALLKAGCHNGVVLPSRLEIAFRESMDTDIPAGYNPDLWASKLVDHVRVNLAMLRLLFMEDRKKSLQPNE